MVGVETKAAIAAAKPAVGEETAAALAAAAPAVATAADARPTVLGAPASLNFAAGLFSPASPSVLKQQAAERERRHRLEAASFAAHVQTRSQEIDGFPGLSHAAPRQATSVQQLRRHLREVDRFG